jgi:hypothetical protein
MGMKYWHADNACTFMMGIRKIKALLHETHMY